MCATTSTLGSFSSAADVGRVRQQPSLLVGELFSELLGQSLGHRNKVQAHIGEDFRVNGFETGLRTGLPGRDVLLFFPRRVPHAHRLD